MVRRQTLSASNAVASVQMKAQTLIRYPRDSDGPIWASGGGCGLRARQRCCGGRRKGKWKMSYEFLYVIATKRNGQWGSPIKVGVTHSLKRRLGAIRTGSPYPVTYFQFWKCGSRKIAEFMELAFHQLRGERRLSGEWFDVSPIEACCLIELYMRQAFALSGAATSEEINAKLLPLRQTVHTSPIWI